MKAQLSVLAGAACALLLAIPLAAANQPAAKNTTKATTGAAAEAWPQETLSGKIIIVDPQQKLLIFETAKGVPFDMVVTAGTRIKSGDRTLSLQDLSRDMNQTVSVTFQPERRGDVARAVHLNG